MGTSKPILNWSNILKRANTLGMLIFVGLLVIAGIIFALLDLIGWQNTSVQALVALLVSPIIMAVLVGVGWLVLRSLTQDSTGDTNHE